ncbi:MAG: methyltransferase domain-containing protein [Candidatus Heimdallarchaeota archaeon]
MKELSKKQIYKIFVEDSTHPFSGWNFSYIHDRMVEEPLSWSYSSEILPYVRSATSMLDMGTGGGELLLTLQPLPKMTCATEAYEPNIPIAKKNLEKIGVEVSDFEDDDHLPYTNKQFDLIINRHESYSAQEVKRILKPKGYFITQQVGATNDLTLNQLLGATNQTILDDITWNLEYAVKQLEDAGFTIIKKMKCFPITRCFDIGAIIYFLKAIPWQIPDFTIEKYQTELKTLHNKIMEKGYIEMASDRFLIIARK